MPNQSVYINGQQKSNNPTTMLLKCGYDMSPQIIFNSFKIIYVHTFYVTIAKIWDELLFYCVERILNLLVISMES